MPDRVEFKHQFVKFKAGHVIYIKKICVNKQHKKIRSSTALIETRPKTEQRQLDWCLLSPTTVPLLQNYIGKVEECAHGEKNGLCKFFDFSNKPL